MKRVRLILIAAGVLCVLLVVTVSYTAQNAQGSANVKESTAVERAIEIAHGRGLQAGPPAKFLITQSTLAEWYTIIDFVPGADAAKLGLDPNRPIWIVAMTGNIQWSGPGRQGGEGDHFDNISIALSVDTLEHIGTVSVAADKPLPLGLQR